jgi:hypothetical protein
MITYMCSWLIVVLNTLLSMMMTVIVMRTITNIKRCLITSELDRATLNRPIDVKGVLVYLP